MLVEQVKIKQLKPYPQNAKRHPAEQVAMIAESIQRFGFKQPLVIDRNGVVIIGHGRLQAAKKLGLDSVPCVRADDLTDDEARALRLIDNKVNESPWDFSAMAAEIEGITFDLSPFGMGFDLPDEPTTGDDWGESESADGEGDDAEEFDEDDGEETDERRSSLQHNVFENQERQQFYAPNYYGFPEMDATQTYGDKLLRFCDWKDIDNPEEYIAHFFYDDYKFIAAWKDPDKYLDRLREFKAVISPDFSLYTDFPRALQILSCYRRQWCGAYWQSKGIDVIPDVIWGDEETFKWCFDGIPVHSVVAVSSVGVTNDTEWNDKSGDMFRAGYNAMLDRLKPTKIIYYGTPLEGLDGDIIRVPSYYEERQQVLNTQKGERE